MTKKKFSMYLAGSIKLWEREFRPRYSPVFNKKISLFEPGISGIPSDHTKIEPKIANYDTRMIRRSDAVLVFMKNYVPSKNAGPAGNDSAWECGLAFGLGKPIIAIVEDMEHVSYFESQWMLTYNISAFITGNKAVEKKMKSSMHFKQSKVLRFGKTEEIEDVIIGYLKKANIGK